MREGFDVVTGGAGFIGSHICRSLLKEGRKVRLVDNFFTGKRQTVVDLLNQFPDRLEVFEQGISDLERLTRVCAGAEVIYHQAALPSVQRSVENPLESNNINIEGTLKLLLAAREAGARKVVFASSSSVYGDSPRLPKREGMKVSPQSPYGITKYVGELYCKVFSEIYGLATVGLRYFNVFGPFQDPESEYAAVIPRFITRMLTGKQPIIFGDGEQSRDFTYVDNVVWANLLSAQAKTQGISLNVACGERYTLNQLVKTLNAILGCRIQPIYKPSRPGDIRHSQADISEAKKKIGFRSTVGFEEGLRRTVAWFKDTILTIS